MSYLYGASVHGIQEFIFKTNKLKEIVGASQIVEVITSEFYEEFSGKATILLCAAGNIQAVFDGKDNEILLEKHVKTFEKRVMQRAFGITVSQSVVFMEKDTPEERSIAEEKLINNLTVQKNRHQLPLDPHVSLMQPNPLTGRPAVAKKEDVATRQKKTAAPKEEFSDIQKLVNKNNKIAVIHADGNNLGKIVRTLKKQNKDLAQFSASLKEATAQAYEDAFNSLSEPKLRKVILGGDDLTVVCSADDALQFTQAFLTQFEVHAKAKTGLALTACAGIAYCNVKFPMHLALSVAETLAKNAKAASKQRNGAPSSLMFHNIQGSGFQDWEQLKANELTIMNDSGSPVYADFGPYYLNGAPSLQALIDCVESYRLSQSPATSLRSWLSELYKSEAYANKLLERIAQISKKSSDWNEKRMDRNLKGVHQELSSSNMIVNVGGERKTPMFDILQLLAVTKEKKNDL